MNSKQQRQLLMTAVEEGTRVNEHVFKLEVNTYGK